MCTCHYVISWGAGAHAHADLESAACVAGAPALHTCDTLILLQAFVNSLLQPLVDRVMSFESVNISHLDMWVIFCSAVVKRSLYIHASLLLLTHTHTHTHNHMHTHAHTFTLILTCTHSYLRSTVLQTSWKFGNDTVIANATAIFQGWKEGNARYIVYSEVVWERGGGGGGGRGGYEGEWRWVEGVREGETERRWERRRKRYGGRGEESEGLGMAYAVSVFTLTVGLIPTWRGWCMVWEWQWAEKTNGILSGTNTTKLTTPTRNACCFAVWLSPRNLGSWAG